ncbi:MAG: hypothetical protein Q9180_008272, partial [Flavoplaca navasiana]
RRTVKADAEPTINSPPSRHCSRLFKMATSQSPNAPTDEASYLQHCGKGKHQGRRPMPLAGILACYPVTPQQLQGIVDEAVEFLATDTVHLQNARTRGNIKGWLATRQALYQFLSTESSWATSALFSLDNTRVPDVARQEAMLRVASDARQGINATPARPGATGLHSSRANTVSPARSSASIAASQLGRLQVHVNPPRQDQYTPSLPAIANLRGYNINFTTQSGLCGRTTLRRACDLTVWANRTRTIRPTDIRFDLLCTAAEAALPDFNKLQLRYNKFPVQNQHELEAAVNDFVNGLRLNNHALDL